MFIPLCLLDFPQEHRPTISMETITVIFFLTLFIWKKIISKITIVDSPLEIMNSPEYRLCMLLLKRYIYFKLLTIFKRQKVLLPIIPNYTLYVNTYLIYNSTLNGRRKEQDFLENTQRNLQ